MKKNEYINLLSICLLLLGIQTVVLADETDSKVPPDIQRSRRNGETSGAGGRIVLGQWVGEPARKLTEGSARVATSKLVEWGDRNAGVVNKPEDATLWENIVAGFGGLQMIFGGGGDAFVTMPVNGASGCITAIGGNDRAANQNSDNPGESARELCGVVSRSVNTVVSKGTDGLVYVGVAADNGLKSVQDRLTRVQDENEVTTNNPRTFNGTAKSISAAAGNIPIVGLRAATKGTTHAIAFTGGALASRKRAQQAVGDGTGASSETSEE